MFMWKRIVADRAAKAEMYYQQNNLNHPMTHRLITSFLSYLDSIINDVPAHFWLSTLSHIIFDYLFAQSYVAAYLYVNANKHTDTRVRVCVGDVGPQKKMEISNNHNYSLSY